jgi:Zn-dependent peptidase ImmA (M78 family)
LFEYLLAGDAPAAIVAPTFSDRQKRNWAFAAEFLVPAAQLRRKIAGHVVTEEQAEDLAEEFGTSVLVIQHQIENYRLARFAGRKI